MHSAYYISAPLVPSGLLDLQQRQVDGCLMYAADLIDLMMPRNDFDVVTALNNLNDQLMNKVKVSKLLQLK